jgi:hypothetical protein
MRSDLPDAFARVVNCSRCTTEDCPTLLRDSHENVPQPGYVGARCEESRILLAGQNPGKCPHRFVKRDAEYTKALRDLAATPNESVFLALSAVLERFVPEWPIHGSYFPLRECGLKLDQIAYCNVVRCRTRRNAAPGPRVVRACIETHFGPWLDLLAPRAVVFVLKWAHDRRVISLTVDASQRGSSIASAASALQTER